MTSLWETYGENKVIPATDRAILKLEKLIAEHTQKKPENPTRLGEASPDALRDFSQAQLLHDDEMQNLTGQKRKLEKILESEESRKRAKQRL